MKIKVLSKKGAKISFLVEGVTPAFANSLRRIMISEVPVMAVDYVNITDNTSAMFDEMLAGRLGLLPLKFDPKKFKLREECKCKGKGCSLCRASLAVEKTGPCMVYSSDLKSSSRNVKPTDPRFTLVELLKNQHLKFEAVCSLGFGKNHAKYQAANAAYHYYPIIEGELKGSLKICPKDLLSKRGKKAVLKDPAKCDLCRACESAGLIVKFDDSKFIFNVESVSGLEPDYIVMKSAEILAKRSDDFKKSLAKI